MPQDPQISNEQIRQFYLSQGEVFLSDIENEAYVLQFKADLCRVCAETKGSLSLNIRSHGGITRGGLEIADFISLKLGRDVDATVDGVCDSAATFVLLACKKRTALPNASFVLHSTTVPYNIKLDENYIKNTADIAEGNMRTYAQVLSFYSRKLGITKAGVRKLLKRGDQEFNDELSPQEAKAIGLITHIAK
tara:strand:+ start:95 stop:670 length:576 start_codon:yes stop_codon:yes gene_type:complete